MTILEEAEQLVNGDRMEAYGHPSENLSRIADLWEAYTGHSFAPRDVVWMMVLTKCSRDASSPKRDNLVDACGYLRTVEMTEDLASDP